MSFIIAAAHQYVVIPYVIYLDITLLPAWMIGSNCKDRDCKNKTISPQRPVPHTQDYDQGKRLINKISTKTRNHYVIKMATKVQNSWTKISLRPVSITSSWWRPMPMTKNKIITKTSRNDVITIVTNAGNHLQNFFEGRWYSNQNGDEGWWLNLEYIQALWDRNQMPSKGDDS